MRARFLILTALLLVALPVVAADRVIDSGIDLWATRGDGSTYIDFSRTPLPAGFFCYRSAPFAGRVSFQGIPVATGEAGVLRNTDTIVQRLDDAVFAADNVAVTRVQVRALHFISVQPIQTSCGAFNVEFRLNGEQPVTSMRIVRQNENGGRFFAPIAVNGTLAFTQVGRASTEILEINRNVRFPANQGINWATPSESQMLRRAAYVLVDTNNDRVPDTYLPGTSNFAAGWSSRPDRSPGGRHDKTVFQEIDPACHISNDCGHCPVPVNAE